MDAEDDAATANWGDDWCMPTNEQFKELLNETDYRPTSYGISGWSFTSKRNDKSISLPYTGAYVNGIREDRHGDYTKSPMLKYWSSTMGPLEGYDPGAYCLANGNNNGILGASFTCSPYCGLPIRPVYKTTSLELLSMLSFNASRGSKQVTINCNKRWTANSNQPWCTVSSATGRGNGNLTIDVEENSGTRRTALVMVKAGSVTKTIEITQEGKK